MWLGELCSSNPLRIPHPKIGKLAVACAGRGYLRRKAKYPSVMHTVTCLIFLCFFSPLEFSIEIISGEYFTVSKTAYFEPLSEVAVLHHRAAVRHFKTVLLYHNCFALSRGLGFFDAVFLCLGSCAVNVWSLWIFRFLCFFEKSIEIDADEWYNDVEIERKE